MSRSTDPGHFFQTTSALEETARKASKAKNTKGNPVKLQSKILAVAADPQGNGQIYVAESAGTVKKIKLEVGQTFVPSMYIASSTNGVSATFTGPTAPLTSLAISSKSNTLFAGCWDKSIWSWNTRTRKTARNFQGHSDFVKAVLVLSLRGRELLVSGSADASIIVWDATTGDKLHTLKGHTRGVLALAIDPVEYDTELEAVTVFSAGSERDIRVWTIGAAHASEIQGLKDKTFPIIAHETSIDSIRFDADGDLWTASADKSVKCLSRDRNWEQDTQLEHPDFVRDVAIDEAGGWVVTACRDEEVRVWEKSTGKLHHVHSGHFEEVTGLLLLPGQRVISVSIDATVRQWSLKASDLVKAIQEAEDEKLGKEEEAVLQKGENLMTEEEEMELAELMGDSE